VPTRYGTRLPLWRVNVWPTVDSAQYHKNANLLLVLVGPFACCGSIEVSRFEVLSPAAASPPVSHSLDVIQSLLGYNDVTHYIV